MLSCCFGPRVEATLENPPAAENVSPKSVLSTGVTANPPEQAKRTPSQSPRKSSPVPETASPKRSMDSPRKAKNCPLKNCGRQNCNKLVDHPYKCRECDQVFIYKFERAKHESTAHGEEAAFRKERRRRNQVKRNAARQEEKAKTAEFVHPPQVFVRVRPLNKAEEKETYMISGLKTETELATSRSLEGRVGIFDEGLLTGFEGVLGIHSTNKEVYDATLADKIEIILRGGQVSMFCYGHTGTGKTHTSMGKAEHPGLFKLACEDILNALQTANKALALAEEKKLYIQVRFTEVHVGKVYDLLTDPKAECMTLEDGKGGFRIRRQPEKLKNKKGWVITGDQKFVVVEDLAKLLQILETGIQSRACGSSSVHHESSRSHAMMEMEIVSKELKDLRDELTELEAKLNYALMQHDLKNPEWNRTKLNKLKQKVERKRKKAADILEKEARNAVGGTLTLADLAGADYDHRTYSESGSGKQELRESAVINQELFSLKECMRTDISRKPWRESVLAKILKKVLQPPAGREAQAIMVATVTPAENQERRTLNTLRYAQQVSGYEDDKTKSAKALRDRDLKRQIRAVYREHCSDKTPEEVDAIIAKWNGKLNRLLAGVWKKYTAKGPKPAVEAKATPIVVAA